MKRLFSLLISFLLIFSTCFMVSANEDYEISEEVYEEDYYDDYYYEDYYEPLDYKIIVDEYLTIDDTGYTDYGCVYYRYTTFADALGFRTTFNAESGLVQSVKGDLKISFTPLGDSFVVEKNGEIILEDSYIWVENIDDRVYIDDCSIGDFFGDWIDCDFFIDSSDNLHIITKEKKQEIIKTADSKLKYMNEIASSVKGKNYISKVSGEVDISIASEFFGISGNGNTKMQVESVREGDKNYIKFSQSNKGLMNFFTAVTGSESPISQTVEIFSDGNHTYFKGKETVKQMLDYEYYAFQYEYQDKANKVLDKWCYSEDDAFSSIPIIAEDATLGKSITEFAFSAYGTNPLETINAVVLLLSDENFTVTKSKGAKTYKYRVDTDTVLKTFEGKEDFEEKLSEFEDFKFTLTLNEKISESGTSSVTSGKLKLINIPNPWNENVFSAELSFSMDEETTFKDKTGFNFPDVSKAVNLTEYVNTTLERDVFYD